MQIIKFLHQNFKQSEIIATRILLKFGHMVHLLFISNLLYYWVHKSHCRVLLYCWQERNKSFDQCCLLKRLVPLHNGFFRADITLRYSPVLLIHGSSYFCWQGNYLLQSWAVLYFKYWSLLCMFDCLVWRQCMPCNSKVSVQMHVLSHCTYWNISSCKWNELYIFVYTQKMPVCFLPCWNSDSNVLK
jgi:hypothetical protein